MSGLMGPPSTINRARHPLVTPSASPPPFPAAPKSSAGRSAARATTTSVAPRVASTPKPARAPSSSRQQSTEEPFDFHKERQASTMRLLDVWSQLAERYTRRLDEDDIVDITTGKIIKDNGVLRNSRKMKFGDSQTRDKNHEEEAEEVEGEEEGDLEQDDDDDELDAFANYHTPADDEEHELLGIYGKVTAVPPVTPQDPRDAADLREFLETERLRRDVLGSEPDDDPEEVRIPDSYDTASSEVHSDVFDVPEEDENDEGPASARATSECGSEESDSEDELNFNLAEEELEEPREDKYAPPTSDSDDDIEIIDPPLPPPPTPRAKPSKMRMQLQTPPLSRTSSTPVSSNTEEPYYETPPPHDFEPDFDVTPEIPLAHPISKRALSVAASPSLGKKGVATEPDVSTPRRKLVDGGIARKCTPLKESSTPSSLVKSVSPSKKKRRESRLKPSSPVPEEDSPAKPVRKSPKKFPAISIPSEISSNSRPGSVSPRKRKRSLAPDAPKSSPSSRPFPEQGVASSSKLQLDGYRDRSDSESSAKAKDARMTVLQRSPRKKRSKSRARASEPDHGDSSDNLQQQSSSETSQHARYHNTIYPPSIHPSPSMHPPPSQPYPDPRGFTPMPDPQTQYIVSQVVQHLSACATGQWSPMGPPPPHPAYHPGHLPQAMYPPQNMQHHYGHQNHNGYPFSVPPSSPMPYTPTHQRIMNPEYVYSTPTHQYAYGGYAGYPVYHPDFSRATAPPDTPERAMMSSPASGYRSSGSGYLGGSGSGTDTTSRTGGKRGVERGARSRGQPSGLRSEQRDSDSASDDEDEVDRAEPFSSPIKAKPGRRERGKSVQRRNSTSAISTSGPSHKGKGKARQVEYSDDEVESSSSEEEIPLPPPHSRGRGYQKGRTPVPTIKSSTRTVKEKKDTGNGKERSKKSDSATMRKPHGRSTAKH